jgi:hypothetical protein
MRTAVRLDEGGAIVKEAPSPQAPQELGSLLDVFAKRVFSCKSLRGLEVSVTHLGGRGLLFNARHPYGPWFGVTVFECDGIFCQSESGTSLRHADVAYRLKQKVTDKAFRAEALARTRRGSPGPKL